MSFKKFIAPQVIIVIILALVKFTGADAVVKSSINDDETNIIKYAQATRSIISNYFSEADLDKMYKVSIKEFVSHIKDSTLEIKSTPVDTTFPGVNISSISDAFINFEKAYLLLEKSISIGIKQKTIFLCMMI